MSRLTDSVFDFFLYFRLGSSRPQDSPQVVFVERDWKDTKRLIALDELPGLYSGDIRVCVISDTHDRHMVISNQIPECDLLIHAGDILMSSRFVSAQGRIQKYREFNDWLGTLLLEKKVKKIVVIGGNHDTTLELLPLKEVEALLSNATFLCNNATKVGGFTCFGSPVSSGRSGNSAFQSVEAAARSQEGMARFLEDSNKNSTSSQLDILVTHGPCPRNLLSMTGLPPRVIVHGHEHANHGAECVNIDNKQQLQVCASIMDARYCPVQLPIVFDLKPVAFPSLLPPATTSPTTDD